jgi:hypothetical protein
MLDVTILSLVGFGIACFALGGTLTTVVWSTVSFVMELSRNKGVKVGVIDGIEQPGDSKKEIGDFPWEPDAPIDYTLMQKTAEKQTKALDNHNYLLNPEGNKTFTPGAFQSTKDRHKAERERKLQEKIINVPKKEENLKVLAEKVLDRPPQDQLARLFDAAPNSTCKRHVLAQALKQNEIDKHNELLKVGNKRGAIPQPHPGEAVILQTAIWPKQKEEGQIQYENQKMPLQYMNRLEEIMLQNEVDQDNDLLDKEQPGTAMQWKELHEQQKEESSAVETAENFVDE